MRGFEGSVIRAAVVVAACCLLSVTSPEAALADVSVSTSNRPTASLGDRLQALFGQGRARMGELDAATVDRLAGRGGTGEVSYSHAWLDARPAPEMTEEMTCFAEAIYFEARGESVRGQFAVAEVILNRVASPAYPDTVCGVVNQGVASGRRHMCQFSYNCDGRAETIHEARAHDRAAKVARAMLDGAPRQLTEGATHYHATSVSPSWSRSFPRTAVIGTHLFYRQR